MPTSIAQKAEGWVSVSEVLDSYAEQGIIDWKIKVGKKEARRIGTVALKIGSRIHQLIEEDWKTSKYKLKASDPVEVKNCMGAWEQFKVDYKPAISAMETEVQDEGLKVVGHIDSLMEIGGSLVVMDFKTSSQVNLKHWLQVSKYAEMGRIFDKVGILRLDKNLGIYEYQEREFDERLVQVFNSMAMVHRYFNPNGDNAEEDANGTTDDSSTDRGF